MMCELMARSLGRAGGLLLAVGLAAGLLAAPAAAQNWLGIEAPETLGEPGKAPSDDWRFTVGLGAATVPDYEGSEDYEAAPVPVLRAQTGYQYGQIFGGKLTSNLLPHPNFRLGLVADFIPERDDVDNNQVDALRKVDAALMVGGLVGYDLHLDGGTLGFEFEATHDVADGNDGYLLTPRVRYRRTLGDDWLVHLATSLTYASDDYMETYFSITPADSARSGLPTFNASDGIKDVGLNTALAYRFTENWSVGGFASWKRLLNDADDSPVTRVGNENQYALGLFVAYSWQTGD